MGKVIGVTGSFATGKTTVANMFLELGLKKIDADEIAHIIFKEDSNIKKKILNILGKSILSNNIIDRKKIANIIFYDKKKLEEYCDLLHPVIIKNIKEKIKQLFMFDVVVDAPLLIEAGLFKDMDVVIVVEAFLEQQIIRGKKKGFSESLIKQIIKNQMSLSEKKDFADYIIDNSKNNFLSLKKGVIKVWETLKNKS